MVILYRTVGANIAFWRKARGLSQEELAVKLGIHRTSLATMELGQRQIYVHRLKNIAEVLNINITDLLENV